MPCAPQVTASTHKELSSSAAALLEPVGSQPLGCLRGEAQQLFTLPQFRGLPITPPAGPAAGRAAEAEPQQPAAPMQHDLRTFNSDSSDSSDSYVANALEMLQLP